MSISLQKSDGGQYRQTIRIHQHTLFADVAAELGGDDSAPDPHDLYDASLAACKAITLLMFAKRKQLALESVDIDIKRDSSKEAQGLYVLNLTMKLNGDLSQADKDLLEKMAEKCPIHKLMTTATTEVNALLI
jgi:putative redox protein